MADIDLQTLGDAPLPKIKLSDDLDIFSGGADEKQGESSHIPNIGEVETSIRVSDKEGAKEEGFGAKVSNFLGFGLQTDTTQTDKLKSDIDQIRSTASGGWNDYGKISSSTAHASHSAASSSAQSKRGGFSKRYLVEKIKFYVRKLNEMRETHTTSEITTFNSMEEIRAEYEELRQEYSMAAAVAGYGNTIVSGAATLEALGGFVEGFPLKTDGLENAISLSMSECTEDFEQIYERYGSIEINPLVKVGATILTTVIKTHLLHSMMDAYGPEFGNDPEIDKILQQRAEKIGNTMANTSVSNMASAFKSPLEPTPATRMSDDSKATQFKSGFHFADELIHKNETNGGGPPPPIHTKITKPPANEETAAQIKKITADSVAPASDIRMVGSSDEVKRAPMKGPSSVPDVDEFLNRLKPSVPNVGKPVDPPTTDPPVSPPPKEQKKVRGTETGKRSRGRKPGTSSTVSIDI